MRPAIADDLPAIHSIYAHHVLHGLATFEEEPPSLEEFARRFRDVTGRGLPYLVAETDAVVAGYGYCAPYRRRSAYRYTLEDSIYVRHDMTGRGVGRAGCGDLLKLCRRVAAYHVGRTRITRSSSSRDLTFRMI